VSAPVVATPISSRTSLQFRAVAQAVVLAIAASLSQLAFAVWSLGSASNNRAVETQSYADGYPMHGGLAGPSRVGTTAISGYAIGYPLDGGLAGPSRVSVFEGLSYPHGGLAGPSRVQTDR
jgi:hypothetical protein